MGLHLENKAKTPTIILITLYFYTNIQPVLRIVHVSKFKLDPIVLITQI